MQSKQKNGVAHKYSEAESTQTHTPDPVTGRESHKRKSSSKNSFIIVVEITTSSVNQFLFFLQILRFSRLRNWFLKTTLNKLVGGLRATGSEDPSRRR